MLILIIFNLTGCADPQPTNIENICSIFKQYPHWYWAATDAEKKYGVPISTQLAIIRQESSFNAKAKPPRERLLWVIPWFRPTSAYGYSQAVDSIWERYQKVTGKSGADRDDFADATYFVAWYIYQTHLRTGVSLNNTYALYLAYHEGITNYIYGTHRKKTWLLNLAKAVQHRANTYNQQLIACKDSLHSKPWWHFL